MKKKRLGQFLLKSFHSTRHRKKQKKPLRQKRKSVPRGLRFSQMRVDREDPVEIQEAREIQAEVPVKHLEVEEQINEVKPAIEKEIKAEPKPESNPESNNESSPRAPRDLTLVVEPSSPVQLQLGGGSLLSTIDLIKPSDQLKQSIEAFLLDQRSPHTRRAYGKDLKRFVQFLYTRNYKQTGQLESLTRTVLIAYKESLLAESLEHTTIDRHLSTLRSFFKWLVDDGVLAKSPAEGVRFLNPKRLSPTIGFSDEEVKKILSLPDLHTRTGSLHYAILMILFYCGLRRSEVCSLLVSNLGTERNQRVLRLRGKGNAERMIVMIPPVWSALQHYFFITRRDITEESYLFLPLRNNRTRVLKKALDPSMIFYIVTRYAKLAGISNRVSPHSCRATAISNARDHQVPDRAIQEFAGWASPDMITRYDKRRTSIEDSAAHGIIYGAEDRPIPQVPSSFLQSDEGSEG